VNPQMRRERPDEATAGTGLVPEPLWVEEDLCLLETFRIQGLMALVFDLLSAQGGEIMSMYNQILLVALRDRPWPHTNMATSDALSVLLDCRQHLGPIASSERDMNWSSTALANQVAYDIALIDLARCVGLDCDPSSFEQPQRRRTELERELSSRGVRLHEIDQGPIPL
jgi:hypothetical protein